MVCDKCGTEVTKNNKFCPKCGAEIVKGRKAKVNSEVEEYKLKDKEIEKLAQSFASRDEKYIASLGNGYIMNYLTNKGLKKGFAFLTDKRVYFKGSCLSGKGKSLVKTDEERTVDVKNITGSGFIYQRYWGILIALIMSLIVSLAGTVAGAMFGVTGIWEDVIGQRIDYQSKIDVLETAINELDEIDWETDETVINAMDENGWDFYRWDIIGKFNYQNNIWLILISIEERPYHSNVRVSGGDGIEVHLVFNNADMQLDDEIAQLFKEEIKYLNSGMESMESIPQIIMWVLADFVSIGLCLSLVAICCKGIKNYLLKRKTFFRIEYAGGCIAFDVSFYAKAEIDDFQKQLRRVKDLAEETTTIKTVAVDTPVQAPTQNSAPDDLRKYADLLKEGLISQEEYDAMKKKILGL